MVGCELVCVVADGWIGLEVMGIWIGIQRCCREMDCFVAACVVAVGLCSGGAQKRFCVGYCSGLAMRIVNCSGKKGSL